MASAQARPDETTASAQLERPGAAAIPCEVGLVTSSDRPPSPTAPVLAALAGDLADEVARLAREMPRAGSEGFVVPTDPEKQAFGAMAMALAAGQPVLEAEKYGYQVLPYADAGDGGAESLILRERSPVQRAWGLYVFRISQPSAVIIEAPHPMFDGQTSIVATSAYRALKARALLIAGAHRDANVSGAADVAHSAQSVFQSVHQALAASGEAVVLQFHGFSNSRHYGYPQVVLASPRAGGGRVMERMAGELRNEGLTVGMCRDDSRLELCGRTNAQALASGDALFIHLELDESVRNDAGALIAALERALGHDPASGAVGYRTWGLHERDQVYPL